MAGRKILLAETIADLLIENPTWSRAEIAEYLGISYTSVCLVIRADSFRDLLGERKAALISAAMGDLHDRARAATEAALERLEHMISRSADPEFVLRASMNLMDRVAPPPSQDSGAPGVQINLVDPRLLAESRARLLEAPQQKVLPAAPVLSEVFGGPGDD